MKLITLIVAVLALLAVVMGCGSGGASGNATDLSFGSAPWKDGDKLSYNWLGKDGAAIGTLNAGFARDGQAWVLTWADKIGGLDQTMKVRVDGTTLKPLGEEKTIKAPSTEATVNTTYKDGKLDIKAVVNGENKSAAVDVPANAIDNDQLLMTLRALKFADGYQGKCVVVNGANATLINTTIKVAAKESVTVPAGAFDAWKVELDFGQAKQYAWYQSEAPNNLVQYDNGQTKLVLTSK